MSLTLWFRMKNSEIVVGKLEVGRLKQTRDTPRNLQEVRQEGHLHMTFIIYFLNWFSLQNKARRNVFVFKNCSFSIFLRLIYKLGNAITYWQKLLVNIPAFGHIKSNLNCEYLCGPNWRIGKNDLFWPISQLAGKRPVIRGLSILRGKRTGLCPALLREGQFNFNGLEEFNELDLNSKIHWNWRFQELFSFCF